MISNATVLNVKCHSCQEPLIRLARSETDDFVYCPNCGGILSYEEVVKNSAGLTGGILTREESNQLRVEGGLDPKKRPSRILEFIPANDRSHRSGRYDPAVQTSWCQTNQPICAK
jgi:uncharacterized Zn finger protein (UPF0148 family)